MNLHPPTPRRHDIDALRVMAFAVLILYHVGMFYVADWGWHVKSSHQSEALQLVMRLVNPWRMPLLFVISGIASSFLLRQGRAGRFAADRTRRLLVPLLFGMAMVVPPQAYYEALSQGVIEPGYGRFLMRYFSFYAWPAHAFAGASLGITWMHLWYLPYLLLYTLLLVPVAWWLRGHGRRLHRLLLKLRGGWLVVLPTVPLILYGVTLFPVFGGIRHTLVDDGYAHAMFFTYFLYGYLIGTDDALWAEIRRLRWPVLGLAVLACVLCYVIPADLPAGLKIPLVMLNRWLWILAVMGWSYAWLNRPFRWLPYACEAVYPWYILHQTITVWIGFHITRLALGPVVEPLIVLAVTVIGCLLLHEFVIRRSRWLRPLFGLRTRPHTQGIGRRTDPSAARSD